MVNHGLTEVSVCTIISSFVVESDIKKHARLNMMAHLLDSIPYRDVPPPDVELPERMTATSSYVRPPRDVATYVPDHAASLLHRDD